MNAAPCRPELSPDILPPAAREYPPTDTARSREPGKENRLLDAGRSHAEVRIVRQRFDDRFGQLIVAEPGEPVVRDQPGCA